jgi:hypothetical protein
MDAFCLMLCVKIFNAFSLFPEDFPTDLTVIIARLAKHLGDDEWDLSSQNDKNLPRKNHACTKSSPWQLRVKTKSGENLQIRKEARNITRNGA